MLEPLILLVGSDALAERVCLELTATAGQRVHVVWPLTEERAADFVRAGATVSKLAADSDDSLTTAGIAIATAILTLSNDDQLNLAVALRARTLNPNVRIVLRQTNTVLGKKIEQNLPDCAVLSLAAHSATTFGAAALDPGCSFALRFPDVDGDVYGFINATAETLGLANVTVAHAEQQRGGRVIAIDGMADPRPDAQIRGTDTLMLFAPIRERHHAHRSHSAAAGARRSGVSLKGIVAAASRVNPILRVLAVAAIVFFSFSYGFFHFALGKSLTASAFYVVETMTNVGFGEVEVTRRGPLVTLGAIATMLGGIVFTSIFIGYVSSALTRAQWFAMQGLRPIRVRDHVVVCGAGKIGGAVIDFLTAAGKRVVVVETSPGPALVRRAQKRDVDLLTGDAALDGALDLCSVPHASAVLVLTDSDPANLEIALAVRALDASVPLVVRMEGAAFARATTTLFGIATFSPSLLTAPAFAGLARFPGTRGRVKYANDTYTISQRTQGAVPERPPADICTALCVQRGGKVVMIREFEEMKPYDVVLFSVPLAQFRHAEAQREIPVATENHEPLTKRAAATGRASTDA